VDRAVWPKVRAAPEQRAAVFAIAWDRFLAARTDRDGIARRQAALQARIRELDAKQERIELTLALGAGASGQRARGSVQWRRRH